MILFKFKSLEQELRELRAEVPQLERSVGRRMGLIGWSLVASLAIASGVSAELDAFPELPRIYGLMLMLLIMGGLVGFSVIFEARAEDKRFAALQKIRELEDQQYKLRTVGDSNHG